MLFERIANEMQGRKPGIADRELIIKTHGSVLGNGHSQENSPTCGAQPALREVVTESGGSEKLQVNLPPEERGENFENRHGAAINDKRIAVARIGNACVVGTDREVFETAYGFTKKHGKKNAGRRSVVGFFGLQENIIGGHASQLQSAFGCIGQETSSGIEHERMPCRKRKGNA